MDYEADAEYLRFALRVGRSLWGEDGPFEWAQWLPKNLRPRSEELDWKLFEQRCQDAGGLRTRLPLLIRYVSHTTGNLWLDVTWEYGWGGFEWTEQDINVLTQEWRDAQTFMCELDPLLDRIEQHPRYWLTQFVKLWNASIKCAAR